MPHHDRYPPDDDSFDLSKADPETQKKVMTDWFLAHYTDPNDNSPYESAEGGYIYIWGGPYDAQDKLSDKFGGVVPDEVIEELAGELNAITTDWTGNPDEHALDEYEFEISRSTVHRASFDEAITIVEVILNEKFIGDLLQPLWRQQYTSVFSAMEAYLFDFFYSTIQADKELFRKFVKVNKEFENTKVRLADIFEQHEKLDQTVREHLSGLLWHNLPRIAPLYKLVLGIEFDKKLLGKLSKAVLTRHDIVHRNGKKTDGTMVVLSKEQVIELIAWVRDFVQQIETAWRERKKKNDD
jgi:hypothetical protein